MSTTFNPVSTSGIGFKLEHYVQASYLASLLTGTPVPFGQAALVQEINFQAKLLANTDDLIVTFSDGTKHYVQSKKGFEINANETFYEVIKAFWEDFNTSTFDKSRHMFILTTDLLSKADAENGLLVLEWARFSKDSSEYQQKLRCNAQKRVKYDFFADAVNLANGSLPDAVKLHDFLKTIYIKTYDYLQKGSKDKQVLEWYLQPFVKAGATAENLLLKLLAYVQTCNQHGATITAQTANEDIKKLFDLTKSSLIETELRELIRKSESQLQHTLHDEIDGYHINRSPKITEIQEQLAKRKIVVIAGEGGVGKSGLAKEYLSEFRESGGSFIFFKADALDRSSLSQSLGEQGVHSSFETLLAQWRLLPKLIIYIDSFEKLFESDHKEAFLEVLGKIQNAPGTKVLATCRRYAIETLRSKYRIAKEELGLVELFPLTDLELASLAENKPELKTLIENPKLKRIVALPFYLDIALQHIDSLSSGEDLSEVQFKRFLWEHVVEKQGAVRAGTSKKRALLFSSLLLKRAIEKIPFVQPAADWDHDVIAELEKDELIIKHPTTDSYATVHDLFEDMVVIRHLNQKFQEKENTSTFIHSIDTNPVFRRGTRLWIQELLIEQPEAARLFLKEVLPLQAGVPIATEIFTGILGSEEAYELIKANVELFIEDNLRAFFKAFHLMKTVYTEPYIGEHPQRKLKCFGPGWTALLKFMDEHMHEDPKAFALFRLEILEHWCWQFEPSDTVPAEGAIVAKHAWQLFQEDKERFRFESKKRKLEVVFFVASFAASEIESMLSKAITARRTMASRTEYRISDCHDLFQMILKETFRCVSLYRLFPELTIELAQLEWYYDKDEEGDIDEYSTNYREHSFGFNSYPYDYFSASAYQTPFRYWFRFHPELALAFLLELCNYSITFYLRSRYADQENTKQVCCHFPDGKDVQLYGNASLWETYRGLGNSPYLLQSALMAFEEYLLNAAETKQIPDSLFEQVIKDSTSVLMPAVLASVAMAFPLIFERKVFLLLQNGQFFGWDLTRYSSEMMNNLHTTMGNEPYYTRERHRSNQLKHRQKNLEHLVSSLQFYYTDEINTLIDGFKKTAHPEDYSWQLALTRMDLRNTTPEIKQEENLLILNPNPLPEELQEFIDDGKEEREQDSQMTSIFLWTEHAFSRKEGVPLNYPLWKENFVKLSSAKPTPYSRHFNSGKKIAALGIRNFANDLTDKEKAFCVRTLSENLQQILPELKKGHTHDAIDIINDSIFGVLPLLLQPTFATHADQEWLKATLPELLVLLPGDTRNYLIAGIREYLWEIDSITATQCFQVLLKCSNEPSIGYLLHQWHRASEEEVTQNMNEYLAAVKALPDLQASEIELTADSAKKILEALQCVPYALLNYNYNPYLIELLSQLSSIKDPEDLNEFEFLQPFQSLLATYFINNNDDKSVGTLFHLLTLEKPQFKFVMGCLKWLVWVGHDAQYCEPLWFHLRMLMSYTLNKSPKVGYIQAVLLEPLKNIDRCYKVSDKGIGRDLHELIITQYSIDRNLMEAVFKLLSGAGTTYQPFCLSWLMKGLPNRESYDANFSSAAFKYIENFLQQLYENHLTYLQANRD